ncbi:MAG: alpha/beta hydrolase [Proteobacteria bacterium]|nr:alpha/beta hydrolase [Pseudomonadota bacterium]
MAPPPRPARLRRWLGRIGIGLLAVVAVALAVGAGYEAVGRYRAHQDYPPRGQRVDIGGRRIHLDCRGAGTPTVVFEAGLDTAGSLSWDRVHDAVAALTRACAYDRAGVMWSDPTPREQDAETIAEDLHATLHAAGIDGPIVLVGHSLGGPYAMVYTRHHPEQVRGLVFVDTSHPDQVARLGLPKPSGSQAALNAILNRLSWTGLVRAFAPDSPGVPGMSERTRTVSKAYLAETLGASLAEERALERSLSEAGRLRTLGDRPLVVLTGLAPFPPEVLAALHLTTADGQRIQSTWRELQDDEASWSSRSRHLIVTDSGHYVQDARPDLVISAVREVVDQVRGATGDAAPATAPAAP